MITDEQLTFLWLTAGGEFHGPNIEYAYMPKTDLFSFLRHLLYPPQDEEENDNNEEQGDE